LTAKFYKYDKKANKHIPGSDRRRAAPHVRGLSPERRLITILAFCIIFGSMSIYITVSSIYNIGKRDAEKKYLEIEHIEKFELQHSNDSTNHGKKQIYERQ